MNAEALEGATCSVDDCDDPGIIAETLLVKGQAVWVVWCGGHIKQIRRYQGGNFAEDTTVEL